MKIRVGPAGPALLLGLLAGCVDRPPTPGGIEVRDAWVRAATATETGTTNTAAYMRIVNGSEADDRLVDVHSELARMTELHRTTIDDAGLATMAPAGVIEVPAGDSIALEPGGLHVMLMGVSQTLAKGGSAALILVFEGAGEVAVEAEVRPF